MGQNLISIELLDSRVELFNQLSDGDNHWFTANILDCQEHNHVGVQQSLRQLNEELQSFNRNLSLLRLDLSLILTALKNVGLREEAHSVFELLQVSIVLVEMLHAEDVNQLLSFLE